MAAAFRETGTPAPTKDWQDKVMADIRRQHVLKSAAQTENQGLTPVKLMWRFAVASVALAALLTALYLSFPNNSRQSYQVDTVNDIPYNSYETSVNVVAGL